MEEAPVTVRGFQGGSPKSVHKKFVVTAQDGKSRRY